MRQMCNNFNSESVLWCKFTQRYVGMMYLHNLLTIQHDRLCNGWLVARFLVQMLRSLHLTPICHIFGVR